MGKVNTRLGKACSFCRAKKIKCDKVKPVCGSCTKRDRADLCNYQEEKWTQFGVGKDPDCVIMRLDGKGVECSSIGTELVFDSTRKAAEVDADNLEFFDFHRRAFPCHIDLSHGPLTWVSLLRKDVYLNTSAFAAGAARNVLVKSEDSFNNRESFRSSVKRKKLKINDMLNDISSHGELMRCLKKILTNRKLIWCCVDDFFNSEVFMMFPFVDRDQFTRQLSVLIGDFTEEERTVELSLSKTVDLSIIGILLIVMKLSYASKYNFNKPVRHTNEKVHYILSNTIIGENNDLGKVLERIKVQLLQIKVPRLEIFQFLMFKYSYETYYAPESVTCVKCDCIMSLSELLKYANDCKLNVDPDTANFDSSSSGVSGTDKNLLRRLWYSLLNFDSEMYLNTGTARIIDTDKYNTILPQVFADEGLVRLADGWIIRKYEFLQNVQPILDLILSMKKKSTLGEFKEFMDRFEEKVSKLQTVQDIISTGSGTIEQRCINVQNFLVLIDSLSFQFIMNYNIYLHFSHHGKTLKAVDVLLKMIDISGSIYESALFIDSSRTEFDLARVFGSGLLVFPKIENAIHRVIQINFGILWRLKALRLKQTKIGFDYTKDQYEPAPGHLMNLMPFQLIEVMNRLTVLNNEIITYTVMRLVRISDVYYHSWIVSKMLISVLTNVLDIDPKTMKEKSDFLNARDDKQSRIHQILLEGSRLFDCGFENYGVSELQRVHDKLLVVRNLLVDGHHAEDNSWDAGLVFKNDKKWLKQMLNDYIDHNQNLDDFSDDHHEHQDVDLVPTQVIDDPETEIEECEEEIEQSYPDHGTKEIRATPQIPTRVKEISVSDILSLERAKSDNLNSLINGNVDLTSFNNKFLDEQSLSDFERLLEQFSEPHDPSNPWYE